MQAINLSLTLDEVNFILESLGQMPYIKVNNLINKIQQQGASQLQQEEAEKMKEADISLGDNDTDVKADKEVINPEVIE